MTAQQLAAALQATKTKNLAFFERYFPNIFRAFKDTSLTKSQLNIDPNTLEVNLLENGKAIYPLNVKEFNANEARQFSEAFRPGFMNHPLARARPEHFYRGRFGHGSIANFLEEVQPTAEAIKPYTFEHSLPQVVFLGCGLGLHISELLKIRKIKHVVLVEHNPDRFLASMYLTDYEEMMLPYINDKTTSFTLSVGNTTNYNEDIRIQQGFAGAWNNISKNVPFMPIQTVFYVHQGDSFYGKVAERLNDEILTYINIWGYYDDEVNQLNHVLHNIEQKIPVLRKIDLSKSQRITLICGNGPSLDVYLPLIKKYRDKINVIAAGSATHSLLKNDIYPEFMVNLESDYATYKALQFLPLEKAKKIPIIGAAQIHPKTFSLFSDGLIYLKNETSYAKLFDKDFDTIEGGTPSAANAALSLSLDLNLPNVHLVGMDFGFSDRSKTHSSSSFYSEEDKQKDFDDFKKRITNDTYKVETNSRGDIYTTPFYNTARSYVEKKIRHSLREDIINLSLGATITGTTEESAQEFEDKLKIIQVSDQNNLFSILKKNSKLVSNKQKEDVLSGFKKGLNKFKKQTLEILKDLQPNMESIEEALFKINQNICFSKDDHIKKLEMSIRGIIWHWLFNYYALCKEYDSERKLEVFTEYFKQYFGGFIHHLPEHWESYITNRANDDPRLYLSVAEAEPNIDTWFEKVKAFKLKQ